jgi:hypothetical protein
VQGFALWHGYSPGGLVIRYNNTLNQPCVQWVKHQGHELPPAPPDHRAL